MGAPTFTEFERAGWEEGGRRYDAFFTAVSDHNLPRLLAAARVGPGRRVLDVGCGAGNLAAAAAVLGAEVVGTDLAQSMVELAREGHPGIDFRTADAEHLAFADSEFDAVVGNLLLPHLPDPPAALAEMVRVLKPTGWLALSMWDQPTRSRLVGVVADAVAEVGVPPPGNIPAGPPTFRYSDSAELSALLRGSGLRNVEVEQVAFTHSVGLADDLRDAWTQGSVRTAATVRGHPVEVQDRIRRAFYRQISAHQSVAGYEVPVAFLIGSGSRA